MNMDKKLLKVRFRDSDLLFFVGKSRKKIKKRKEIFGKVLKFDFFCVTILTHAKVMRLKIIKFILLRVLRVKKTNIIINNQNKNRGEKCLQ